MRRKRHGSRNGAVEGKFVSNQRGNAVASCVQARRPPLTYDYKKRSKTHVTYGLWVPVTEIIRLVVHVDASVLNNKRALQ